MILTPSEIECLATPLITSDRSKIEYATYYQILAIDMYTLCSERKTPTHIFFHVSMSDV